MSEYELRLAPDSGEDAEEELRSLLHWLREDENLGPGVRGTLRSTAPPGAEDMGAGLDLVALIAGSALSSGSLVFSVLEWRAGRRRGARAGRAAGPRGGADPRGRGRGRRGAAPYRRRAR